MVQVQLTGTCEAMSDLMPVYKIAGMKDRNAREILKGGSDQIIILAFAADRWVGIEAWEKGIG